MPSTKISRRFSTRRAARLLVPAVLILLGLGLAAVVVLTLMSMLGLLPGM